MSLEFILKELIEAAKPFTSGNVVDETIMKRLEKVIKQAELLLGDSQEMTDRFINGSISGVITYNSALSPSEVAYLYSEGFI